MSPIRPFCNLCGFAAIFGGGGGGLHRLDTNGGGELDRIASTVPFSSARSESNFPPSSARILERDGAKPRPRFRSWYTSEIGGALEKCRIWWERMWSRMLLSLCAGPSPLPQVGLSSVFISMHGSCCSALVVCFGRLLLCFDCPPRLVLGVARGGGGGREIPAPKRGRSREKSFLSESLLWDSKHDGAFLDPVGGVASAFSFEVAARALVLLLLLALPF